MDKTIALYEGVLERDPDPVTADIYRLTMAEFETERIHRAVIKGDLAAAVAASDRASTLFSLLAQNAHDPEIRQRAAVKLLTVRTRGELSEDIEATQGRFPTDVRPGVNCVEKLSDGSSVIWFAYQNLSGKPITELIGARNKFTPPPFDRSQPTTFTPGLHDLVFSIPAKIPEVTWHLQKSQLVVKLRDVSSMRCRGTRAVSRVASLEAIIPIDCTHGGSGEFFSELFSSSEWRRCLRGALLLRSTYA